jgi:hypothetical protein
LPDVGVGATQGNVGQHIDFAWRELRDEATRGFCGVAGVAVEVGEALAGAPQSFADAGVVDVVGDATEFGVEIAQFVEGDRPRIVDGVGLMCGLEELDAAVDLVADRELAGQAPGSVGSAACPCC